MLASLATGTIGFLLVCYVAFTQDPDFKVVPVLVGCALLVFAGSMAARSKEPEPANSHDPTA